MESIDNEVNRKIDRRKLLKTLGVGGAVGASFLAGSRLNFAQATGAQIPISYGSFATDSTYEILQNGSNVVAKNGSTGAIDSVFTNTDFATVLIDVATALSSSGGKISLKGSFPVTKNILIDSVQKLIIEGDGSTVLTTTPVNASIGPLLTISASDRVKLLNIALDRNCNVFGAGGNTSYGLAVLDSTNIEMAGLEVTKTGTFAVNVGGSITNDADAVPWAPCSNVYFHHNYIHDTYQDGYHVYGGSNHIISNNLVQDTGDDSVVLTGMAGYVCSSATISDNILNSAGANAIKLYTNYLQHATSGCVSGVAITGNSTTSTSSGFDIYLCYESDNDLGASGLPQAIMNVAISGNTCAGYGLLAGGVSNLNISGNYIHNGVTIQQGFPYFGVKKVGSNNINILGNTLSGVQLNTDDVADTYHGHVLIAGNSLSGVYYGVQVGSNHPVRDVKILSNAIGSENYGVYAGNAWDLWIMNNIISDSYASDIYLNQYSSNSVYVIGNDLASAVKIVDNGDGTAIKKHNLHYITEKHGNTSITGAVNSVAVSHGMNGTPTTVNVTPLQNGQGAVWVTSKGSNTFTINFVTQPASSTWYFDYDAKV